MTTPTRPCNVCASTRLRPMFLTAVSNELINHPQNTYNLQNIYNPCIHFTKGFCVQWKHLGEKTLIISNVIFSGLLVPQTSLLPVMIRGFDFIYFICLLLLLNIHLLVVDLLIIAECSQSCLFSLIPKSQCSVILIYLSKLVKTKIIL